MEIHIPASDNLITTLNDLQSHRHIEPRHRISHILIACPLTHHRLKMNAIVNFPHLGADCLSWDHRFGKPYFDGLELGNIIASILL